LLPVLGQVTAMRTRLVYPFEFDLYVPDADPSAVTTGRMRFVYVSDLPEVGSRVRVSRKMFDQIIGMEGEGSKIPTGKTVTFDAVIIGNNRQDCVRAFPPLIGVTPEARFVVRGEVAITAELP
jgi:hypothetical protein